MLGYILLLLLPFSNDKIEGLPIQYVASQQATVTVWLDQSDVVRAIAKDYGLKVEGEGQSFKIKAGPDTNFIESMIRLSYDAGIDRITP